VFMPGCVSEPAGYWSVCGSECVCVMHYVCTLSICFLYQCEEWIKVRGKTALGSINLAVNMHECKKIPSSSFYVPR
jgi:uncharacterized membrane protein